LQSRAPKRTPLGWPMARPFSPALPAAAIAEQP
jgi:hypothetical protein